MVLRYFDAFSGIGGFSEGIRRVVPDAECIGYSEIDKYAIKIYEQHFPNRTNYGDIRRIDAGTLPDFDMFCGGFPCQDVSIAGKRKGLCGARSGLFFELIRIVREKQPRLVFLENVKGLLSSNEGWDFARILVELDEAGYDVEWQVLNSKDFGVPQNRERVFIIGHLRGEPWKSVFPIGEDSSGIDEGAEQTAVNTFTAGGHSGGLHSSMTLVQIGNIDTKGHNSIWGRVYDTNGVSATLNGEGGGLGAKTGLYLVGHTRDNQGKTTYHKVNVAGSMKQQHWGNQQNYLIDNTKIRRLTPLECERLQGFSDGWTDCGVSDTQRYRCLGNAVTVNVIEAIMKKLQNCV